MEVRTGDILEHIDAIAWLDATLELWRPQVSRKLTGEEFVALMNSDCFVIYRVSSCTLEGFEYGRDVYNVDLEYMGTAAAEWCVLMTDTEGKRLVHKLRSDMLYFYAEDGFFARMMALECAYHEFSKIARSG
jgi:hypothetical protein